VVGYIRNEKFDPNQWLLEPSVNCGNDERNGGGRSVMLGALKILYFLGFRKVFLLGVDFEMTQEKKYHFPEHRGLHAIQGNNNTYRKLQRYFEALQPHFLKAGFIVKNCNPTSRLTAFPFISYEEALEESGAHLGNYAQERTEGMYQSIEQKMSARTGSCPIGWGNANANEVVRSHWLSPLQRKTLPVISVLCRNGMHWLTPLERRNGPGKQLVGRQNGELADDARGRQHPVAKADSARKVKGNDVFGRNGGARTSWLSPLELRGRGQGPKNFRAISWLSPLQRINGALTGKAQTITQPRTVFGSGIVDRPTATWSIHVPWEPISAAVIVTGRNRAAYLRECLDSIFSQSRLPDQVVYIDDGSEDGSMEVARCFSGRGLAVHRHEQCLGIPAARNKGVELTSSELILHVDSDNILPTTYLSTMMSEMPGQEVVYPKKRYFGPSAFQRAEDTWIPVEYDRAQLWKHNYMDTCSLIRRASLLACGGWRETPADYLFDWDLMLRLTNRGSARRSNEFLHYRLHGTNWTKKQRSLSKEKLQAMVRRHAASITLATVWSGRLPGFFGEWIQALRNSLSAAGKTAELIVMDDSLEGMPAIACDAVFNSVVIRRIYRGKSAVERRQKNVETAQFLAGVFADLLSSAKGDVVWFVEDDILVPKNAANDLLASLLGDDMPRAAVAGIYRSRHDTSRYTGADFNGKIEWLREYPREPKPIDMTGTGCLMILKDLIGSTKFGIEWRHKGRVSYGHDWVFTWGLKMNGTPVLLLPTVPCRHYQDANSWV
jgi:glycosyltransferase involved in cell wall biosynthesis